MVQVGEVQVGEVQVGEVQVDEIPVGEVQIGEVQVDEAQMNIQEGYHIKVYYQLQADFPLLNIFHHNFGVQVLIKEYLQGMHEGHQKNEYY